MFCKREPLGAINNRGSRAASGSEIPSTSVTCQSVEDSSGFSWGEAGAKLLLRADEKCNGAL